jgi:hypothetical protein
VGFPTAVYSPKHRSGRCILQRLLPIARKDTAAYASLPLSTMSKSKIPRHQRRRREPRPSRRAKRQDRKDLRQDNHTKAAAVDEPYLVKAPAGVNSIRKDFASSFRRNTAAAQVQIQ